MSEWKVVVGSEQESEIRGIYNYIANTLLVPDTAAKQVLRILDAIQGLGNMPMKFPLYEKEPWRSRGLRRRPIDNFVIFYWINEKANEVVVFHIFYGGRNIENILEKEK